MWHFRFHVLFSWYIFSPENEKQRMSKNVYRGLDSSISFPGQVAGHLCVYMGRVSEMVSFGGLSSTGRGFCIMRCVVSSLYVFQSLLLRCGGFMYSLVFIRPKHKEHKELTNPPQCTAVAVTCSFIWRRKG